MASKPEIEPQAPVIVQTGLQEGDVTSKTSEIREPISDEKTEADATVTLSGDDDIINQVRDSTFRFNQAEFERKMRELSATSDLPPVDAPLKLATVIWSTEYCHQLPFCEELISLLYHLMSSTN